MTSPPLVDPPAPDPRRTWGFRMSAADIAALAAFGVLVVVLRHKESSLWWLLALAAIHFFLFCNVFRLLRRRELIWAGFFVGNVALWTVSGRLDLFNVLACQLPVTVGVLAWEIKAPRYHGIFAARLNPRLNEYLQGRTLA